MAKYVSVPVEVEAIRFTGGAENAREIQEWINEHGGGSITHAMPVPGGSTFEEAVEHLIVRQTYGFEKSIVTVGEVIFIKDTGELESWDGDFFHYKFVKKE